MISKTIGYNGVFQTHPSYDILWRWSFHIWVSSHWQSSRFWFYFIAPVSSMYLIYIYNIYIYLNIFNQLWSTFRRLHLRLRSWQPFPIFPIFQVRQQELRKEIKDAELRVEEKRQEKKRHSEVWALLVGPTTAEEKWRPSYIYSYCTLRFKHGWLWDNHTSIYIPYSSKIWIRKNFPSLSTCLNGTDACAMSFCDQVL